MLCGGSLPPPVLSYHSIMVLLFASDGSIAHRGFRASLTFISRTGESQMDEDRNHAKQASVMVMSVS